MADTKVVVGLLAAGVAVGLAYAATRTAGPVSMTKYTEQRTGPLAEHLVTLEELGFAQALTPHRYPTKVAPGLSALVKYGFAPLYRLPDPDMAALPAEAN